MSETIDTRGGLPVTPQQAAVVDSVLVQPVTVVGAGAGSGKTHTTLAAVLALIEAGQASLDRFVLITFTDKAAGELRRRIEDALAERAAAAGAARQAWDEQRERMTAAYIGTIHGFCRFVLANYGYAEGVAREAVVSFAIQPRKNAFADAAEELLAQGNDPLLGGSVNWLPYQLPRLGDHILSSILNRGLDPSEIRADTEAQPEDAGKPYRTALARYVEKAAELYKVWKADHHVLDGHDLLRRAVGLLSGPDGLAVVDRLSRRFGYLFVDEFQDTDGLQKTIVDILRSRMRVLVVGDRKQSIYGFRGARSYLVELATETGVPVLPLNVSRRATPSLLGIQNTLFRTIGQRYPDLDEPLEPASRVAPSLITIPPLTLIQATAGSDMSARIAATAAHIRWLLGQQIPDPDLPNGKRSLEAGDIAVVVRSNYKLRHYETGLGQLLDPDVRVRAIAGGLFYQRPEVVSTYRMLLLLLRHPEDAALAQALGTPYLRNVRANRLEQLAVQFGGGDGHPLTDQFETDYPDVAQALRRLRDAVARATVPELLADLYDAFDIFGYYHASGDGQAVENLEKLREVARGLFRNEQALTLRQFVATLRRKLLNQEEEDEAPSDIAASTRPPHVRLLTAHRSKGLEFPIVIVPEIQGAVRGSSLPEFLVVPGWGLEARLPLANGQPSESPRFGQELAIADQERVEEEFRIFYVALTRAQVALVLVGRKAPRANAPNSDFYSWQDEVLSAWPALTALGAKNGP